MAGDALVAAKPAQEAIDTLSVSPKPAISSLPISSLPISKPRSDLEADVAAPGDRSGTVIALASLKTNAQAADTTAAPRQADGLVTVRPKPEKRKNYKERAKERIKERAKEKDSKKSTEGGTTPDTTAKAKPKVPKVKDKVEAKAAAKAKDQGRGQEGQEDQIGGPHSRLSLSAASRNSPPSAPGCVKRPPPRTGAKRVWGRPSRDVLVPSREAGRVAAGASAAAVEWGGPPAKMTPPGSSLSLGPPSPEGEG